tara:strand:+ start:40 stop:414 length:375 start_codon:yes stop_codon:yes gene_type:complete
MASTKGSKVLGNAKKAGEKAYAGRMENKGSGSYGPKTTDAKMVGKVAQSGTKTMKGIIGVDFDANRYTAARGSDFDVVTRATGLNRKGSQFNIAQTAGVKDILKSEKGRGFDNKSKAKVVAKKK